jgi:CBS domain-containing protein
MTIRVADVMSKNPMRVAPDLPLPELQRRLISDRVGGYPVVEDGKLVGLVSRSDVVRALDVERSREEQITSYYRGYGVEAPGDVLEEMGTRLGDRMEHLKTADAMVQAVVTVGPDASVEEVAKLFVEHGFHRVPVTEGDALVGVVTSLDLVGLIASGRLR